LVGSERPAVLDSGTVFDLAPLTADIDGAFLESDGIARVHRALGAGSLKPVDIAGQRLGAPIARPSAVVCVGMNYAAHAAESGAKPPERPVLFFKTPNTVIGPDDDVVIPKGSVKTDWEVELAIVIGRRAAYLDSPADSPNHIAGYTVSNDVSEREWQLEISGGQWSKGKCAPTFNPLGPYLVPVGEFDAAAAHLTSTVNGEARQDSNTRDMIFSASQLVWEISQYLTLEPGDIINTGTPQGVALSGRFPYLKAGDTIEMTIDGIGTQRQRVRDHSA
jgi:2-keto-4-pentenoate hydratase/2-oxohepta-3-ene-1,7-dioic acid hydratase in catechol pathway